MMPPDPSLDTSHAAVHPGGSPAPEPHGTHQAAPPLAQTEPGPEAEPQAGSEAAPQGEQAGSMAGPQQEEQAEPLAEEQAGIKAEEQAGEQAGPQAGSLQGEQQGEQMEVEVPDPASSGCDETDHRARQLPLATQPTTDPGNQAHLSSNQPAQQADNANQAYHTAELHEPITELPEAPGVYDGEAPGGRPGRPGEAPGVPPSPGETASPSPERLPWGGARYPVSAEAHGVYPEAHVVHSGAQAHGTLPGEAQGTRLGGAQGTHPGKEAQGTHPGEEASHGVYPGVTPGGEVQVDLPYHGVTPGGQVVYHGELQGTYLGEAGMLP